MKVAEVIRKAETAQRSVQRILISSVWAILLSFEKTYNNYFNVYSKSSASLASLITLNVPSFHSNTAVEIVTHA